MAFPAELQTGPPAVAVAAKITRIFLDSEAQHISQSIASTHCDCSLGDRLSQTSSCRPILQSHRQYEHLSDIRFVVIPGAMLALVLD